MTEPPDDDRPDDEDAPDEPDVDQRATEEVLDRTGPTEFGEAVDD